MVRVFTIPAGGWELLSEADRDLLRSASLYHSDPSHGSFAALVSLGLSVSAMPEEGVEEGVVCVPAAAEGPLYELRTVVNRLLGPGGCPWDQEQTHVSLKRYLLEEAYEVLDAIDAGSEEKLREELGDLLLQPYMHAGIAGRDRDWGIDAVAREIVEKLVRRHPHVFGELELADADEVLQNWDKLKQAEKGSSGSRLGGVPNGMASLLRAYEISKRAVRAGFEWPDIDSVFEKLREEEAELKEALALGDAQAVESEIGDLLFTVVNIARWAKVEPEEALRKMVNRFTARFMEMERLSEKELEDLSLEEWDQLWERAKLSTT
jgi:tetrapyrrole methylase family protein/MazG family protein